MWLFRVVGEMMVVTKRGRFSVSVEVYAFGPTQSTCIFDVTSYLGRQSQTKLTHFNDVFNHMPFKLAAADAVLKNEELRIVTDAAAIKNADPRLHAY